MGDIGAQLRSIKAGKAEFHRLRTVAPRGVGNLDHVHDLALTSTSNAIEGNPLTAVETTLTSMPKPSRAVRHWHRCALSKNLTPAVRAPSRWRLTI